MISRRQIIIGTASALMAPGLCFAKKKWDLIIVGSGVAGLSAAVSSLQSGAKSVLILEKSPVIGGHSIVSTGYVSAVDPKRQKYKDSPELMLENMLEIGGHKNDTALAEIVCQRSFEIINWLEDVGVKWEPTLLQTAAGLFPRSHISNTVRAGYDYVMALNSYAIRHGAKLLLNTKAESLITEEGRVVGVTASLGKDQSVPMYAGAVILATGGFTANVEMRTRFDPRLGPEFATTANPFGNAYDGATGDAITMTEPLGAALKDAQYIQLIPFWGGRLLDYVGGDIFVNKHGKRFVSESASWKEISEAVLKQPDKEMWAITDSQSRKGASLGIKLMNQVVRKANSVQEMASIMHVEPSVLAQTLDTYNRHAKINEDPIFHKNRFTQTISVPPYYFGIERLCVHFCCGGVRFNKNAQVIRKDGSVIEGLYVCGEASGGPHGHDRMGGVALTSAFVFGKIAGEQATQSIPA